MFCKDSVSHQTILWLLSNKVSSHICLLSSPLLYWLWLCSCPWLFVEKMKRSSWQRRKSLSSSKSSILFCSQEFFSREICSWVRKLVITMYELLTGDGPADGGDSEENIKKPCERNYIFCADKGEIYGIDFDIHHQNWNHSGWKILAVQSCSLHRVWQFRRHPHFLELSKRKFGKY